MITVRPAQARDVGGIEGVARQTWGATYAGIISPESQQRLLESFYSSSALEEALRQEKSWFFVAEEEGEVVGYAQFVIQEDGDGQLTRIYVLPEKQRQGMGRLLMEAGIRALGAEGSARLIVQVEQENHGGVQFYRREGFRFERAFSVELLGETLALCEYVLPLSPADGNL